MGVPTDPILPVPEVRLTAPLVAVESVKAPDLVIVPEPLALTFMVPLLLVETLAPILIPELLPLVERPTVAVPVIARAAPTVRVPPELTVTGFDDAVIAPKVVVLEAPVVLIASECPPSVIV